LLRSRERGQAFLLYAGCVFFRIARTVFRLTLKVWAIPAWEILWPRARTIASSFSGVSVRGFGVGVKHVRQVLQRQRAVLPSFPPFFPKRITSRLEQEGQGRAIMKLFSEQSTQINSL
jgi:hypothetical protein